MIPGYFPAEQNRPYVPINTLVNVTSTTYLYSDAFFVGPCVQGALCVKATLGAGVTSVELKLQQGLTNDALDDWFDWPLVDTANKVTVSNEYVSVVKSYTLRIDASTGLNQKLGPIAFPLLLPYMRLAYKITGAGTANIGVLMTRANLTT